MGFKGIYITQTCFPDEISLVNAVLTRSVYCLSGCNICTFVVLAAALYTNLALAIFTDIQNYCKFGIFLVTFILQFYVFDRFICEVLSSRMGVHEVFMAITSS